MSAPDLDFRNRMKPVIRGDRGAVVAWRQCRCCNHKAFVDGHRVCDGCRARPGDETRRRYWPGQVESSLTAKRRAPDQDAPPALTVSQPVETRKRRATNGRYISDASTAQRTARS